VFARPLVSFYVESFSAVPGKLELTIRLARIMFPFLTLVTIAAAIMGMLNSTRRYFVPALAPATFNIVAIVFAVAVTPLMPRIGLPRIASMAFAAIVGGFTQVGVQWPLLRREGFRYRPHLDAADPGLRQVLLLMGPGTIGVAATQLNLLVTTVLAAQQGTGAVSWLQYAFRVMYLPLGLFGVSIATAVLPAAARHAALHNRAAIRDTVAHGLALMLLVNVPATCGLVVLATPIVRLLFEHGHFLPADTAATAAALRFYAIGLVGYSTTRIASPVFYALGRSRIPVALSVVSVGVNIALSLLFVPMLGFAGLALAPALAALVNGLLCLVLLRRQLDGLGGRRLAATLAKVVLAAAAMSAAVVTVNHGMYRFASADATSLQALALAGAIGSGVVTLAIGARLLRIEEFTIFMRDVQTRVQKLLPR
jgi:putative peptidoglycan lipid II flippase